MSSVYGRLGFNFDTTKFNGADNLSTGVLNLLGNTTINLSNWQESDLANAEVNGYFKNPHNDSLGAIAVFVTGISLLANTSNYEFDDAETANTLANTAISSQTSLLNFTYHTNNLSGVTRSSNTAMYPDLNSALAVGRQMLNITNKTDGVQNNTPILGNFTSLYVANDISIFVKTLANDYITLSNSIGSNTESMNANNSISNTTMNVIISNIQSFQTLIDTRTNSDIAFYTNSYQVLQEYMSISQFSNLGATQNSLIVLIGTDKLQTNLGIVS
jgi:hypothetical protein